MTELTKKEIFQNLFGQQVYLPFNKRILLFKIKLYLEGVTSPSYTPKPTGSGMPENEEYHADFYFDVFLYDNYDELVQWCIETGKTIQYLD